MRRLLLCAALVCALIGAVSAAGGARATKGAHAVATVDEDSAEAVAMQLDKKIYDFLRMLRVEELLDEMKHSLSLSDGLAQALSQRWSAAFPQFLRRVQELCLKSGAAYEYLFPKISELWEDYTQDVGVLLQKAIDEQFNELAAAKGVTVRPPERPTETERSAAKRTIVFFNKLADLLNEEVSAALDVLVNGKSVTYARSLVLSFIGVLDQVENLHGTPECKRWLAEFLAAANASVWASARSTEGRVLTVDIRDARSIAIAALEDTVLGKTLQSWRLYWWFKRHYWWRGSVTPSRHEPDMERLATTLVADRFVVALHEAESEITAAVLKVLDHAWKATWSLEMKVFSPVVTLVNPDAVSFFSPLDPEPMLKGNITSLARVPCLEAWVEQSAQFYNASCGNLRHAKRARYWFSSHSLASTGLLVAILLLVISTLLCLSPCFCCCLCCYGCYKTPLLMLGLLGAAMGWLFFSIGRILLS